MQLASVDNDKRKDKNKDKDKKREEKKTKTKTMTNAETKTKTRNFPVLSCSMLFCSYLQLSSVKKTSSVWYSTSMGWGWC